MLTRANKKHLPLVYCCNGPSTAAQTANHVALELDRRGIAEMSCVTGLGADIPAVLKQAQSGRRIIAIDGCPVGCTKKCLARHAIETDDYLELGSYGVKKKCPAEVDGDKAAMLVARIADEIAFQRDMLAYSAGEDDCVKPRQPKAACF